MATQPKRNETKPLEGEALARAMAANPELVAASNEAKRRADAGEPGILIRASALKIQLPFPFLYGTIGYHCDGFFLTYGFENAATLRVYTISWDTGYYFG